MNRTTVAIPIKAAIAPIGQASVTVTDANKLIKLAPQCIHRYHVRVAHDKEEGVVAKLIVGVGGLQHVMEITISAEFRKARYELLDGGEKVHDRALIVMGDTTPGHRLERVMHLRNTGEVCFKAQVAAVRPKEIFTCTLGSSTGDMLPTSVPPQFAETVYALDTMNPRYIWRSAVRP